MKTQIKYAALFVAAYAVFLISTIPASWVVSMVSLPKGINVSQVTGTIWHTHVDQVVANKVEVNDIELDLSLISLLMFNPAVDVSFGGGLNGSALIEGPKGEARISDLLGDISADDVTVKVPAQFIVEHVKLPVPIEAHNEVTLTVDSYTAGKPYCQALSGNLAWPKAAGTGFNETIEVGSLKVGLGCTKGNIELVVDKNNDLGLTFTGILAKNNRFSGNGYLQPGDKFPKRLRGLVSFLGKKDKEGRYKLKL